MPPLLCSSKCGQRAVLKRPKTGDALCKECFYWAFETEIHFTITKAKLFKPGDYVAIGASGGKDSTVLAHVMKTLNERFNYGLKLVLLSIGTSNFWFKISQQSLERNCSRVSQICVSFRLSGNCRGKL